MYYYWRVIRHHQTENINPCLVFYQDLSETFSSCVGAGGQFELEESVEAMLDVIRAVNDSLHQINIKVRSRV